MLLTCSAYNRSAIVENDRRIKAIKADLRRKYGACMYRSDIDEHTATARHEAAVPAYALLTFYAALRRRRGRTLR